MSHLSAFMVHPVTLAEPQMTTNSYGDQVADWSAPPAVTYSELGWFTRTGSDEMSDGREAITDHYELTLPPSSAINAAMRVEYMGDIYEVRGSIGRAQSPNGTHHLVAQLRRVVG